MRPSMMDPSPVCGERVAEGRVKGLHRSDNFITTQHHL